MANSLKHVMSANLVRDIAVTGQKVAPDNMSGYLPEIKRILATPLNPRSESRA